MLTAHLRSQDENEEMGRELAEGKVHELERGAALAKGFADDLRRAYASLEDHASSLDRENEDLQVGPFFERPLSWAKLARQFSRTSTAEHHASLARENGDLQVGVLVD